MPADQADRADHGTEGAACRKCGQFSERVHSTYRRLCALPPNGFGLGGAWGWIEPDSDGTADATATFCAHSQGQNGAFHENLNGVPWTIVSAAGLPPGTFAVGTDPTGKYIVFPNSDLSFVAFPVTPGHYATTFGVPGITAQSTVTLMH